MVRSREDMVFARLEAGELSDILQSRLLVIVFRLLISYLMDAIGPVEDTSRCSRR